MRKYLGFAAAALVSVGLLQASPASAAPVQWAGNGHYYELIQGSFTFNQSVSGAAAQSHLGLTGHLVTITSAAEQTFLNSLTAGTGLYYIGASDSVTEGDWEWVTGPETGSFFEIAGVLQPGFYSNWAVNEPNNLNNEDHIVANWAAGGAWNDGGSQGPVNYVVEFSVEETTEVPAPGAVLIFGLALLGLGVARRKRTV